MTRVARTLLVTIAITLMSAPVAAYAQTSTRPTRPERPAPSAERVDEAKRRCLAQIDRRVAALDARQRELGTARHLTAEHKAALDADINKTRDGLETLAVQIAAYTDSVALRAHCESIWTDYRVFALVLPRTRLVATADAELFAADRLTGVATRLQSDAMKSKIASASSAAGGVADSILPLTPADWNANHNVLVPAQNNVRSARADLKAAAELGREVVAALKA